MIGSCFDVVVGFLIRTVVRFFKVRTSETWPVEKGTISDATCPLAVFGGPVGKLRYSYIRGGSPKSRLSLLMSGMACSRQISWFRRIPDE